MKRISIHRGIKAAPLPFEYWCENCKQLRLSYADITECGNCGAKITMKGKPGELDAEKLRGKDYKSRAAGERDND